MKHTHALALAASLAFGAWAQSSIVLAQTPSAPTAQAAPAPSAAPAMTPREPTAAPATTKTAPMTPSDASGAGDLQGLAVVMSSRLQGRKTANGERYDRNKLTAAHKTLPFGTMVRVTSAKNKKSVVVRINDRGPFTPGRVIDLSTRAAKALGLGARGSVDVRLAVVKPAPRASRKH